MINRQGSSGPRTRPRPVRAPDRSATPQQSQTIAENDYIDTVNLAKDIPLEDTTLIRMVPVAPAAITNATAGYATAFRRERLLVVRTAGLSDIRAVPAGQLAPRRRLVDSERVPACSTFVDKIPARTVRCPRPAPLVSGSTAHPRSLGRRESS